MTGKASVYSFLISFLLAGSLLVIFMLLCPLGGKYKLSLVSQLPKSPNEIEVYHDIDHDGSSEYFRFFKNFGGTAAIITEQNGAILHQWNLNGNFAEGDFFCIADCNADGVDEVLVTTYRSDSIFLNGYDIKADRPFLGELFVSNFRAIGSFPEVQL